MCGVCAPAGGSPRRCRRGGRQRYPAGGVPALPPANPAFRFLFCPHPPDPLPGGKGVIFCFLMQGAAPLASPGLNPRGTGSPCRCGKLNGRLASALPARRASAVPGGGLPALSPAYTATVVPAGGGVPALPPVNPAFNLLPCPPSPEGKDRPPAPFPAGRG